MNSRNSISLGNSSLSSFGSSHSSSYATMGSDRQTSGMGVVDFGRFEMTDRNISTTGRRSSMTCGDALEVNDMVMESSADSGIGRQAEVDAEKREKYHYLRLQAKKAFRRISM